MDWQSLETFSFGDHPALADELVGLVLEGKKRATCWAVSAGLKGAAVGKPMVALDGKNRPRVVLKTIERRSASSIKSMRRLPMTKVKAIGHSRIGAEHTSAISPGLVNLSRR
jgi:uncharacterized protein YhfF